MSAPTLDSPLVSVDWLHQHKGSAGLRLLDATWFLPTSSRDGRTEYEAAHIEGAVYFDIDDIADHATDLPHMIPSAADFAREVAALGISNSHKIVVYDSGSWMAAPRVWWMFRLFGHDDIAVLDGGLKAWTAAGYPVTSGIPNPPHSHYLASFRPELLRRLDTMRMTVDTGDATIVDTRSLARFQGREDEPRPGVRPGHIPGAKSVHYQALIEENGLMKPPDALRIVFDEAGVDPGGPLVTSCGSGVSAAIAALALARLDRFDVPVYDGSWSEWGQHAELPIAP